MAFGPQWICVCSFHNSELRMTCRGCGRPASEATGHESWETVDAYRERPLEERLQAERDTQRLLQELEPERQRRLGGPTPKSP